MRRALAAACAALVLAAGCSGPSGPAPTTEPSETADPVPRLGDPVLARTTSAEDDSRLTGTPHAVWLTGEASAARTVRETTSRAAENGQVAQLVVYAVPGRDCGLHSAGGLTVESYGPWVEGLADAVVGSPLVVLEPDALAQLDDCGDPATRSRLLAGAARTLSDAGARVYVDVGNSAWLGPEEAASRLLSLGPTGARGFAVNVSNYRTTEESVAWADEVSRLTDGLHYVVDTSRNGNGPNGQWCNARGRALGDPPRLVDDGTRLDALLWVKVPGESDGPCGGGPPAGTWWPEIAEELAANDPWAEAPG
ncbi:glycoside hydrolase family 6 protein [Paraoerskovia marina]|uniref:glycoside hydrolase family 6 protein n=1 Tax=Paraoerskovia marina TaxID=545619 RepID=UPI0005BDAC0A|nr:glycoside hydrolase family 6 protein [Paraoerskovia marina]